MSAFLDAFWHCTRKRILKTLHAAAHEDVKALMKERDGQIVELITVAKTLRAANESLLRSNTDLLKVTQHMAGKLHDFYQMAETASETSEVWLFGRRFVLDENTQARVIQ